jgi:putative hydrolase of the HAD superfamily
MGGNRRFDAVFFDLGHTLVAPHPSFEALLARVCAEHGVPLTREELDEIATLVDREIGALQAAGGAFSRSMEESRRFWVSLYGRILDATGRAYPGHLPETLCDRFTDQSSYQVYPDVIPTLTALRESGVRLGAISNWEAWAEQLLHHLGLTPWFDVALISGVVGIEKPDPRLFRMALEQVDIAPERAAHVGDSPTYDCAAAHAVGITPVLLDRYGRYAGSEWTRIEDLRDFAGWVLAEP